MKLEGILRKTMPLVLAGSFALSCDSETPVRSDLSFKNVEEAKQVLLSRVEENNYDLREEVSLAVDSFQQNRSAKSNSQELISINGKTGDFNEDGRINIPDFLDFLDNFGYTGNSIYDIDGNRTVDFDDFFIFANNFGKNLDYYSGPGKLLFSSDISGDFEIYSMIEGNHTLTNLTNNPATDITSSWSPDGSQITFSSNRANGRSLQIYTMNSDGSNVKQLTNEGYSLFPEWSPDGTTIAFSSERNRGTNVYLIDSNGENERKITNNGRWNSVPVWTPNGESIVFASSSNRQTDIFIMDSNGNNQINLTNNPSSDYIFDVSPDGNKIVFVSSEDLHLNLMNIDGSNTHRIFDGPSLFPEWSPDGERIAYVSMHNLIKGDIYSINPDGSDMRLIRNNLRGNDGTAILDWWGPQLLVSSPPSLNLEEIITEPIQIIKTEDSSPIKIFEGQTNEQGRVSFSDPTSHDGRATLEITDIETNQPVENFSVRYFDDPSFKLFIGIDPNGDYLPTGGLYPHNSPHLVPTAPKTRGTVHIQTIDNEEGFNAFYEWDRELGPNIAKFKYLDTIGDQERIETDELSQMIIMLIAAGEGLATGNVGGPKIIVAGQIIPTSIASLAEALDPYARSLEGVARWDVYQRSDISFTGKENFGFVELIPSNIPTVDLNPVQINSDDVEISWDARDKDEYEMPFGLPSRTDLTIFTGSTEESDLDFDYYLEKENTRLARDITTRKKAEFTNLEDGIYTFSVTATDEVDNISEPSTTRFRIGNLEENLGEDEVETLKLVNAYDFPEDIASRLAAGFISEGLTFDGENYWYGGSYIGSFIYKLNKNFQTTDRFVLEDIGVKQVDGLAWKEEDLWVCLNNNWIGRLDLSSPFRFHTIDGFQYGSTRMLENAQFYGRKQTIVAPNDEITINGELEPIGEGKEVTEKIVPEGLDWDGEYFWTSSGNARNSLPIYIKLSDRLLIRGLHPYNLNPTNIYAKGIAWEDQRLWVSTGEGEIHSHNTQFDILETYSTGVPNINKITYDGEHLIGVDSFRKKFYKFEVPD